LIACVIGEDSNFFKSVSAELMTLVESSSEAVSLCSSLECLAFTSFVCCVEKSSLLSVMEAFEKVFRTTRSAPVMEPQGEFEPIPYALVNWALIAVTAEPRQKVKEVVRKQIPYLVVLLEHQSVSVRMASAQTLAILFTLELHWSNAKEESFELNSWGEVEGVETSQLEELTSNLKLKHPNRADHALQKDLMKSVHSLLLDSEEPSEKLVIFKKKMEVTGFVNLTLLQILRNVLASGLPLYCMSSEVVQDLLDLHADPDASVHEVSSATDGLTRKMALEQRRKARERGVVEGRKHRDHDKQHSLMSD